MVAGGVAAILYAEPRLTQDIDVVVALQARDAGHFANQFPETEFYCPPVEVIAQETARAAYGHFNVLHLESDARADVYLVGDDALSKRGLATRRVVQLVGLTVPIASPDHVHRAPFGEWRPHNLHFFTRARSCSAMAACVTV